VLRFPSLRAPLDILFLLCCIALTADVLVPEIWGSGKTKDYPLWYWAGQQVLHGGYLYINPSKLGNSFEYIYPPLPAILLAIPSYFGKIPLYLCLSAFNAVAWWMTAQFSNAMTGSGRRPGPWLFALPAFATITSVFDMFDLGQPNLVLLAIMLFGFWLLQHQRPWMAGSMFALATAIKVFPVTVLPYLLWRRQWASAASLVVWLGIFVFVVPAPVRGYQQNISELKTWFNGMVGSEQGFGQRAEQNWSWINQSIIAVTHRLTRPVNYNQDNVTMPPRYMNLVDLDFTAANWIVAAISLAIGLGFIAVMPARSRITPRSNAEELGILFCLMTVASPLARQYYFMWLFFPVTILMHRAAYDPRPAARLRSWITLTIAGLLASLSLPFFPKVLQAYGNDLAATFVLAGGLAWHILHPLPDGTAAALPPAAGELQPDRPQISS
jgi:glycosyl transferase family 87